MKLTKEVLKKMIKEALDETYLTKHFGSDDVKNYCWNNNKRERQCHASNHHENNVVLREIFHFRVVIKQ